ncbi:MAG: biopolymer transporter ExbD [Nitrospinota bacterium]|nr:biopolymer transporter ExbD [Nitrospinota bacterium]
MEFKGVKRVSHLPNLTPMIDIVLLLLVFFLLTAHFVKNESINVDLPSAESSVAMENNEVVAITLDPDGRIFMDGSVVEESLLESRISMGLKGLKKKMVVLHGDKAAMMGKAVLVMDAAKKAGADSMDIVTQKP